MSNIELKFSWLKHTKAEFDNSIKLNWFPKKKLNSILKMYLKAIGTGVSHKIQLSVGLFS